MTKVVVAMSGGVDSTLAAALMKEAGHEVIGIMLKLWAEEGCTSNRCCTPEAVDDAQLVADQLGIPFYVFDYKDPFKEVIVDAFTRDYLDALTPNPCIRCNGLIRFGRLMEEARGLGAEKLVTGHYAKIEEREGIFHLHQGLDLSKDQSYVLYRLNQEQLAHTWFPLSGLTKEECRRMAAERNLLPADKPDSQDLCFVGDGDYRNFLTRQGYQAQPGDIIDHQGKILGKHTGLPFYTVGQRKGLGITTPEPYYVLALDGENNRLIVGPTAERRQLSLHVKEMHYLLGHTPTEPIEISAKIRYNTPQSPATLTPLEGGRALVTFVQPVQDPAPGQSLVCYLGDEVLGGGFIEKFQWKNLV